MLDTIIKVENLSKKYTIGQHQEDYLTLRDALSDRVKSLLTIFDPRTNQIADTRLKDFWALKNISFEINQGDRVGIVGRNGAGKSTLLKILSRITEPTNGSISIKGRVASLLEVGTGFHPELTGRENVFLNGAILGMSKAEIKKKFDEIVSFAEVEKFLDTPVKRYSSGMYVRLAFAVAAHLEPEILIVDEVLAVGDAQFQKKCLGKMEQVGKEGRTVIFVSHNMDSVQRLCDRCIWLSGGELQEFDSTKSIVERYMSAGLDLDRSQPNRWMDISNTNRTSGNKKSYFSRIRYFSETPDSRSVIRSNLPFICDLEIEADLNRKVNSLSLIIFDKSGFKLVNTDTLSIGKVLDLKEGHNKLQLRIENLHLNPGVYILGLWLNDNGEIFDYIENVTEIEIGSCFTEEFSITPNDNGAINCEFDLKISS
jgi:lipopolysaccharide transport system ATP-binding protein